MSGFIRGCAEYCGMRKCSTDLEGKVKIQVTTEGTGIASKISFGWVENRIVNLEIVKEAVGGSDRAYKATNMQWNVKAITFDNDKLNGLITSGNDAIAELRRTLHQDQSASLQKLDEMYSSLSELESCVKTWQTAYEKVDLQRSQKLTGEKNDPANDAELSNLRVQMGQYREKLQEIARFKASVRDAVLEIACQKRIEVLEPYLENTKALYQRLDETQPELNKDISDQINEIETVACGLNPEEAVGRELAALFAPFRGEEGGHLIFGRMSPLVDENALNIDGIKQLQLFKSKLEKIRMLLEAKREQQGQIHAAKVILDEIRLKRENFKGLTESMAKMGDLRKRYPNENNPQPLVDQYETCVMELNALRLDQHWLQNVHPDVKMVIDQHRQYCEELKELMGNFQSQVQAYLPLYVEHSEAVSKGLPLDFSAEAVCKEGDHFILEANGHYVVQEFYPEAQKYVCEGLESDTPWTLTKFATQKRVKDIGKGTVSLNPFRKK